MKEEFLHRKINFSTEMQIPVEYKGKVLDVDFRCDFFVENCIVVELKAVQEVANIFEAQLLTYMKLLKSPKGVLINFNCSNIFNEGLDCLISGSFGSGNSGGFSTGFALACLGLCFGA